VADRIRAGIESGVYRRGELLPREEQLAEDLEVHRATVNKALKLLLAEGLVRVHRGVGTQESVGTSIRMLARLREVSWWVGSMSIRGRGFPWW
jgi:DNA-binding GntR family transcriptional regulator